MGRLLLQDRNILMVSARRGSERDRRSGRSHESVRTKESTDAAPSRWRQACPNGPERLLACSALAGVLLALVMLQAGCVLAVGDQPGAWEEVELFAVQTPSSSYYRGSLPIAAGDGTLVFEVVAGKAAEGGNKQPGGWWHYVEFYRGGQYITGKYESPAVGDEAKLFDTCRSYVPGMATRIQFGFGKTEETAPHFRIDSARLLLRRPAVELTSPADGSTVAHRMPRLAWRSPGHRFTVEIATDRDFTPTGTRRRNVANRWEFRVPEVLPEGTWYWRVMTPDGHVSQTRSFVRDDEDLGTLQTRSETTSEDDVAADPGCRQPVVRWTKSRGILIGDPPEPFYPIGIYMVRETEMEKVKAAGFNLIQHYAADGGTDEYTRSWLDEAHKHGLKAFVSLNRKRLEDMDLAYVTTRVKALRNHPALLAWYLFDEPEVPRPPQHYGVSPYKLEAAYERIKRLDGSHPVLLTCYNERLVPDYLGCFDVYLTQAYDNEAAGVARETLFTYQMLEDYPAKVGNVIVNNKIPFTSYDEVRAGAYIAMIFQSGLLWWGWRDDYFMRRFEQQKRRYHGRFGALSSMDARRDAFQAELSGLVHELRVAVPILEAPGRIDRFVEDGVYGYIKTTASNTHVVLVCLADEATVSRPLPGVQTLRSLLPPERDVRVDDGLLHVSMRKGEVAVLTGRGE